MLILLRTHIRQHRVAILRRGEDRRHLADARHRHLQRAGNRGRGHRQHVHVRAQRLDVLLVFHAEALLLVHDDQPQVLPVHARLQQAVGTDHDVHRAVGHAINNLLGLRWGGKARQLLDGGGKVLHALAERVEVLLRQQGRRHQHGHLLAGLHGLECGTHRHLGLAIAHVTDNHAIHRHRLFHVGLHSLDGVVLILGLGEREGIFHLPLPGRIRGEGIARRGLAAGVELHQLARDLTYSTAGLALGVLPIRATHLRQRGLFPADVARQHIQLIHRHVKLIARPAPLAGRVLQHQVFAAGGIRPLAHGAFRHLHELADAVGIVHHQVARLQRQRVHAVALLRGLALARGLRVHAVAGQVRFREEQQARALVVPGEGEHQPLVGHRVVDAHLVRRGLVGGGVLGLPDPPQATAAAEIHADCLGRDAGFLEAPKHAGRHGRGWGREGHPSAGFDALADVAHQRTDGLHLAVRSGRRVVVEFQNIGSVGVKIGHPERRQRPPGPPQLLLYLLHRVDRKVSYALHRRRTSHRRNIPAGLEELLAGFAQVVSTAFDGCGRHHQRVRTVRHELRQRHQLGRVQRRDQRFHPLHLDLLADLVEDLGQLRVAGVLLGKVFCFGRHLVRDNQFPARIDHHLVRLHPGDGPLVADAKGAHLRDLVAPEVHADGHFLGRGEDVHDAAADGEVAALTHHVHVRVPELLQTVGQRVEVDLLPHLQSHRRDLAQIGLHGLHSCAGRSHHHLQVLVSLVQAAQYAHAGGDCLHGRGKLLVRQGLPRRE